jgi:hypothetical protein
MREKRYQRLIMDHEVKYHNGYSKNMHLLYYKGVLRNDVFIGEGCRLSPLR